MAEEQQPAVSSHKYRSFRLAGKVAVVSGGTSGIGLAVAERFGHEGARLVVSSRKRANVDRAVGELLDSGLRPEDVVGCVCHVGRAADRRALVECAVRAFGRIDVLFHNAGVNPAMGDILEVSGGQLDKLVDTNVSSAFFLTQLAVPHMPRGAAVVFNSTVAAFFPTRGILAYGAVKAALLSLTAALSRELAPRGVRVNCLAPATTRTRMAGVLYRPDHEKHAVVHSERVWLLPRIAEPEEVAGAAAYLASDDSSFVSGETHLIVGGIHCRL
ncbi:Dehydrogenase/reductase SDR family member 4 [Aphelenchoides fujianensis]|nr:Dehydrogenase/reductase SDR family member 4 [Aphelenchoides fujianensis]